MFVCTTQIRLSICHSYSFASFDCTIVHTIRFHCWLARVRIFAFVLSLSSFVGRSGVVLVFPILFTENRAISAALASRILYGRRTRCIYRHIFININNNTRSTFFWTQNFRSHVRHYNEIQLNLYSGSEKTTDDIRTKLTGCVISCLSCNFARIAFYLWFGLFVRYISVALVRLSLASAPCASLMHI